jgi:DNA-binding NarL/FixJ family response regulator
MTSIAVIDKHPIVRFGLGVFLRENCRGAVVVESESLGRFYEQQPENNPDLFILGNTYDLMEDYQQLIVKLRKNSSAVRIIMYDEHPEYSKVELYLKAGVKGYISKTSDIQELLKCVSEVDNGKTYISSDVMEVLITKLLVKNILPHSKDRQFLTRHEYEIARSLADGERITSIAHTMKRKISTISTIKKNVFKKLHINHIKDLAAALSCAQVK